MPTKIFLTSLIIAFLDIIIMKLIGEYKDKWYCNMLSLIMILALATATITALIIIWQS